MIERVDVSLKLARAPVLVSSLSHIILAGYRVFNPHDETIVCPGQFSTQCVGNFFRLKNKVKLPEIPQKYGDTILVFLLLDWIFGQISKRLDNCQSHSIKRLLYFSEHSAPPLADGIKIVHLIIRGI